MLVNSVVAREECMPGIDIVRRMALHVEEVAADTGR
jgi:hypothetical protein